MSWRRTQRLVRWTFALAVGLLVALQLTVSAQDDDAIEPPEGPDVLPVTLEVELDGEQATFTWTVGHVERPGDLNPDEPNVTCTLDPDGDDIFEYSIPDCEQTDSVDHLYEEPGVYFARLLARSRDGRSGQAMIRVEVTD